MSSKAKTEKGGRRVLSAPGQPKSGSRAYEQWLKFKRAHGLQVKGGRPAVYRPSMAEAARKLVALGANDFEISQAFGVSPSTITSWKVKHPEFAEALRFRDENGTFADDRVKRSLLHKATGYSFHSEKVFVQDGKVTRVPVVEHVPPSDTAMIFWLKNRDPDRWNDRRQVDINANASVRVAAITATTSVADAMRTFRAVLDGASIADDEHPPTLGWEPDDPAKTPT